MEWYRYQYNIPLHAFYEMNIDEDVAHLDFYRRQYWNELRYGVRQWGDFDIELKIPPYTLYRGNGGTLPVPNGFGYDGTYSVKVDHYDASQGASAPEPKTDPVLESKDYTYSVNPNVPEQMKSSAPGLVTNDETNKYASDPNSFQELLQRLQDGDESLWDELNNIVIE